MKKAWNMGVEPPPYKMLVCAIGAEQIGGEVSIYNWLYFIGYYDKVEGYFFDPCSETKYCSKLVDAWRFFDDNLEHLTMDYAFL